MQPELTWEAPMPAAMLSPRASRTVPTMAGAPVTAPISTADVGWSVTVAEVYRPGPYTPDAP